MKTKREFQVRKLTGVSVASAIILVLIGVSAMADYRDMTPVIDQNTSTTGNTNANTNANANSKENTKTAGQYVSDAAVTTKVKATFLQTAGLSSAPISVKTYNGKVFLSGVVDSDVQSSLAEQTALRVSGVTSVENDLRVRN